MRAVPARPRQPMVKGETDASTVMASTHHTNPGIEKASCEDAQSTATTTKPESSSTYSHSQPYHHYSPYPNMPPPPHNSIHPSHGGGYSVSASYSFDSYHQGNYPGYNGHMAPPTMPAPHYFVHYPPKPLEIVMDPQPSDVLSGRGGATNSHSGNRAFRSLVKKYQGQYLKAKKKDKPAVAALVVDKVREAGGRFLRRHHVTSEGVAWVDIGDEKAKEKTCQALREGAPELRRRKGASIPGKGKSSDDSASSTDRSFSEHDKDGQQKYFPLGHTPIVRTATSSEDEEKSGSDLSEALVIRPSMILLGKLGEPPITLSVDQLESSEREMYLRDFFPPNPAVNRNEKSGNSQVHPLDFAGRPPPPSAVNTQEESNQIGDWPTVSV